MATKKQTQDTWLQPRDDPDEAPADLRKHKKPLMVVVDWIDSTGFGGWRTDNDWTARNPNHCRTVGYLVSQDKESIHLAASMDNCTHLNERQSIPKGCIKRIRRVKEG